MFRKLMVLDAEGKPSLSLDYSELDGVEKLLLGKREAILKRSRIFHAVDSHPERTGIRGRKRVLRGSVTSERVEERDTDREGAKGEGTGGYILSALLRSPSVVLSTPSLAPPLSSTIAVQSRLEGGIDSLNMQLKEKNVALKIVALTKEGSQVVGVVDEGDSAEEYQRVIRGVFEKLAEAVANKRSLKETEADKIVRAIAGLGGRPSTPQRPDIEFDYELSPLKASYKCGDKMDVIYKIYSKWDYPVVLHFLGDAHPPQFKVLESEFAIVNRIMYLERELLEPFVPCIIPMSCVAATPGAHLFSPRLRVKPNGAYTTVQAKPLKRIIVESQ